MKRGVVKFEVYSCYYEGELLYVGSGSTEVACLNTNRKFLGIEMDENYFNIAKDRMEKADV